MTQPENKAPGLPHIDVNEYGGKKDGVRQQMNRRLFMQLLVFDAPHGMSGEKVAAATADAMRANKVGSVVYADANAPTGVGLLTWSDDPAHFVRAVRPAFAEGVLAQVVHRPHFTMIGRTYAIGHEPQLEHWLIQRSVENVMNETTPWHVWYPLRRSGAFARLEPQEQSAILREHGTIGHAYGEQSLATDIRLACHGIDAEDNEFVIGLVGKELHPLSHLVQTMRKTKQTSEFIQKMGPFFVGYAVARTSS